MVLYELDRRREVGLVELVRYVPADWTELPALLDGGVEKGDRVEERLPLRHRDDVQLVLRDKPVRPLQAGLDALRRLGGELDRRLEEVDRELQMRLRGDPAAEGVVNGLGEDDGVEQLFHVVETEVTVVQQDPVAVEHRLLD